MTADQIFTIVVIAYLALIFVIGWRAINEFYEREAEFDRQEREFYRK